MQLPPYTTGAVSVADGETTLVFTGGIITDMVARRGDIIYVNNQQPGVEIFERTDLMHCEIAVPWSSGDMVNVPFTIVPNFPARVAGAEAAEDVTRLVAALNTNGLPWLVPSGMTEPDPSWGDEQQLAEQRSTGKQWHKEGGEWVYDGIFKAFGASAPYDNGKTYSLNDVASSGGSSYVWINPTPGAGHPPPNATYWDVLAGKGEIGETGPGYGGTSSSSIPIGLGYKYFVFPDGYAYTAGTRVRVTASAGNWMEGTVFYYGPDGETHYCTINVDKVSGSGTFSNWTFSVVGEPAKDYGGYSSSSIAIGTGPKYWVLPLNFAYKIGSRVRAASQSASSNWMEGIVTYYAFDGTDNFFVLNVDKTNGSGTFSDWNFSIAGEPGAGDLSSANNLSDITNKRLARGNLKILSAPQGRLTLTSGTPVMSSSVAGASVVYYSPYIGNQIPVYDGTKLVMTEFPEMSQSVSDTTRSPSAMTGSKIYDFFTWRDPSTGNTILGHGPDWSVGVVAGSNALGSSARGGGVGSTELIWVDGIPYNRYAIVNGPAAGMGRYEGSVRTNGLGTIDFIFGGAANGGLGAVLNVYNAYNQEEFNVLIVNQAASYALAGGTAWRVAGNSAGMVAYFLYGLAGRNADVSYSDVMTTASVAGAFGTIGYYLNAGTGTPQMSVLHQTPAAYAWSDLKTTPPGKWTPPLGANYVAAAEGNLGANSTSFNVRGAGNDIGLKLRVWL